MDVHKQIQEQSANWDSQAIAEDMKKFSIIHDECKSWKKYNYIIIIKKLTEAGVLGNGH